MEEWQQDRAREYLSGAGSDLLGAVELVRDLPTAAALVEQARALVDGALAIVQREDPDYG